MAEPKPSEEKDAGVPVVTAVVVEETANAPSSGRASYDDPFSTVAGLLSAGVRVVVRKRGTGTGGVPEFGELSLTEGGLEFTTKGTRTRVTTTGIGSIREVGVEQQTAGQEKTHVCVVKLKVGEPGSSFSFACRDDASGLTSSEITELAAIVMQERYGLVVKSIKGPVDNAYRMTSFAELLKPLGLIDTYLGAFQRAGVRFENLGLITRNDLAKLMGITNRVDQINIFALINRHFRSAPPRLHPTGFDRSHEEFVGLPIVGAHLETGLRVVVRTDKFGKGGIPECGMLSLTADCVLFSVQTERARAAVTNSTNIASIRGVQIEHEAGVGQEGNNVCRVILKERAPGSSFDFYCRDAANGLSSSEVTKLVGSILRLRLNMASKNERLIDHAHLTTPFVELLEPLGLVGKYCRAFAESGIHFENLGVVTRDDLAKAVGVADGADQINILGQIERFFQDKTPTPQTCVCNCRREGSPGQPSAGLGARQASSMGEALGLGDMIGAFGEL